MKGVMAADYPRVTAPCYVPVPMTDTWEDSALCRLVGTEPFFRERGDGSNREALAVCQQCPVQGDCVMANYHEQHGVWGCSERCRKRLRKLALQGYEDRTQFVALARRSNERTLGVRQRPNLAQRRVAVAIG